MNVPRWLRSPITAYRDHIYYNHPDYAEQQAARQRLQNAEARRVLDQFYGHSPARSTAADEQDFADQLEAVQESLHAEWRRAAGITGDEMTARFDADTTDTADADTVDTADADTADGAEYPDVLDADAPAAYDQPPPHDRAEHHQRDDSDADTLDDDGTRLTTDAWREPTQAELDELDRQHAERVGPDPARTDDLDVVSPSEADQDEAATENDASARHHPRTRQGRTVDIDEVTADEVTVDEVTVVGHPAATAHGGSRGAAGRDDLARAAEGLQMKWVDTTATVTPGMSTVGTDTAASVLGDGIGDQPDRTRHPAPAPNLDLAGGTDGYFDAATRAYAQLPVGGREGDIAHATVEQWLDEDTAAGVLPSWPDLPPTDLYDTPIPFTAPTWLQESQAEAYTDYDAEIPFHVVDDYTRHMTSDTGDTGDVDGLDL